MASFRSCRGPSSWLEAKPHFSVYMHLTSHICRNYTLTCQKLPAFFWSFPSNVSRFWQEVKVKQLFSNVWLYFVTLSFMIIQVFSWYAEQVLPTSFPKLLLKAHIEIVFARRRYKNTWVLMNADIKQTDKIYGLWPSSRGSAVTNIYTIFLKINTKTLSLKHYISKSL